EYLGRTVQVVPHITDEIKRRMLQLGTAPSSVSHRLLIASAFPSSSATSANTRRRRFSSSLPYGRTLISIPIPPFSYPYVNSTQKKNDLS
ncbi:MAG: hypothetical protein IIU73_00655, partial [Selenomonadales bacterium]|nr:hypothetical protein [Selenomonadales bacterium]